MDTFTRYYEELQEMWWEQTRGREGAEPISEPVRASLYNTAALLTVQFKVQEVFSALVSLSINLKQ
jgi:hypothetical protein